MQAEHIWKCSTALSRVSESLAQNLLWIKNSISKTCLHTGSTSKVKKGKALFIFLHYLAIFRECLAEMTRAFASLPSCRGFCSVPMPMPVSLQQVACCKTKVVMACHPWARRKDVTDSYRDSGSQEQN